MKKQYYKSQIKRTNDKIGNSIEEDIRQALSNKEPIEARDPMIYTDAKDGVLPQYDPRTDKWDIAQDAKTKYDKSATISSDENPTTNVEQTNTEKNE